MINLPPILRRPLPASISTLRQKYISELKILWSKIWDASPHKAKIEQFGGWFPSSNHHKQLQLLTRKQASLVSQIRCAHFPLNVYLHRINKSDTNECQTCGASQDIPLREMVKHFLSECTAYTDIREELTEKIGINQFHLPIIMNNATNMKALMTYINRTGRFKTAN